MLNKGVLQAKAQKFIDENLKADPANLILKGSPFDDIPIQALVEQIQSKRKAQKKLPLWFNTPNLIYPPEQNLSQSSSEITAKHKTHLVSAEKLIDITGGMGVDSWAFAKKMNVVHCEINPRVSELTGHNLSQLGCGDEVEIYTGDGRDYLKNKEEKVDVIYADPSRRDKNNRRVFKLDDCQPNILLDLDCILEKANNFLLKTSPLLDIDRARHQLKNVCELHIIAVRGEVKELLWVLKKECRNTENFQVKTTHYNTASTDVFSAEFPESPEAEVSYGAVQKFLYEPNPAIMKSGLFKSLAEKYGLRKLAPHTHLFTSDRLIDFPGRCFKVNANLKYNRKKLKKIGLEKANISTRNFPMPVKDLKKQLKIKDGGEDYLFFITNNTGEREVLWTAKV